MELLASLFVGKPLNILALAVLEKLKPVKEGLAGRHPKFKYLSEVCEDCFDSFLAVPVQRGAEKIGVLVVQHQDQDYFDDIDVMVMLISGKRHTTSRIWSEEF
jgi:phosphotransferase system enzyme I (PtsP)